jgi:N12 class adenine-specific DNA methylase/adenine-specific DNA methylase
MTKYQVITGVYESTLQQVTKAPGAWMAFMRSACRNYKCRFDEQILIFAQRPDATAVLEIEKWNKQFGRWVNKGATGIAVFDDEYNGNYRLKHYFDISDTHESRDSCPVPLWTMEPRYEADVIESLENSFGELEGNSSLKAALISAAHNAVDDNLTDYLHDLLQCREDSFLEELDEFNVEVAYRSALQNSVAYMLLFRCGINADGILDSEDFRQITDFNTSKTINALGLAASDITETCLREISATVLNLQKQEKKQNRTFAFQEKTPHNIDTSEVQHERSFEYGTDISDGGRLPHPQPDRTGGTARSRQNGLWQVRVAPKEISETAPQDSVREPADIGQAERTPDRNRADSEREAGTDDQTDGGGAGRDGANESRESNAVGRVDEQYPAFGGGNDSERPDIRIKPLTTIGKQIAFFEEAEESKSSAFSISQQIIDEALTSGGNEENSILRIAAYFKKNHSINENADFLQKEYGNGGKGFIFGGNHVSVWFNDSGIHLAIGDTALNTQETSLITWEQAAKRIRELLDMGRYMPQSELDKVDGYAVQSLAEKLYFLYRDDVGTLPQEWTVNGTLHSESIPVIAEHLCNPEMWEAIIKKLDGDLQIARTEVRDEDFRWVNHFRRQAPDILHGIQDLQRESLIFTADESVSTARPDFITQDEVDRVLCGGSNIQEGKFRIYSYFLQDHTAKDKADFLKNEYGTGGFSRTGFNEWHDSKGITYSRENNHMPYDKVILPWSKVAKRIDELITDGRYMSQQELDYIPEYEKNELAREVVSFYPYQPENLPRPFPHGTDFWNSVKIVRPQLDEPERVAEILTQMTAILDNTSDFDRNYELMRRAFDHLTAYQNGMFSLFTPAKPAEKETVAPASKASELSAVPADEAVRYNLQLGVSVYLGTDEYEIYSFDDTHVVLRDVKFPIFTQEMPRDEFDRKLRENRLNDGLIKTDEGVTEPQQEPDIDEEAELKDHIRDALDWRGYVVSDELIDDGLEEYDNRGGTGNYKDIADFIERTYLTEEETPESLVGKRYEIDGRQFIVDNVDEDAEEIKLRDITFQNSVGFPIFRSEPLDFIRQYAPIDKKAQDLPAEKETHQTTPDEPVLEEIEGGGLRSIVIDLSPHQPAEKEEAIVPSWEKPKRRSRTQTFDPHPEIPMSQRHNYHITDDNLGAGGAKAKFHANIEAIKVLQAIESENRFATQEEQEILARYVGWGGLPQVFDPDNEQWKDEYLELNSLLSSEEWQSARSTTLNAHYTSPTVIKAIYKAVENMGFQTGNILEPSCGIGNFFGLLPESMNESRMFGVELDSLTGRIARQIYQKNSIAIQGFETTELPDSFFDLAIGNVPFGEYKVLDKRYDKHNFLIHDYFFARTLDKVRPGGIVAFVTSKGTLDKQNPAVRKYIAQRADLLGAIRLPNTAFKANAGTEVTTDIIFLQKRDRVTDIEPDWVHIGKCFPAGENDEGIPVNSYFIEHPDMLLGEMAFDNRMYGNRSETTCNPFPDSDLAEQLSEAITNIHAEITEYERDEGEPEEDNSIPADPSVRNFSYTEVDGQIYYRQDSRMLSQELPVTTANRVKGMVALRECVRKLIEYQTEDYPESDIQMEQARLNRLYDDFTRKYGLINSRGNSQAFSQDSSYCLLCSLEVLNENSELERKADMFSKRTIKPHIEITHVDTASEALAVSLAEKARVDLTFMAQLTDMNEDAITKELEGVIFLNIGGTQSQDKTYVTADEYLSGNIREKLIQAKAAAETDPSLSGNVKALEASLPKDLTAAEISVRLGAAWLPEDVIQQFMYELLQTPRYAQWRITVHYSRYTGEWNITEKSYDRTNIQSFNTYGTDRINAYKIIEESLNLRDVRIFDKVYDENGDEKRVLNKKETAIAQAKQELIRSKFEEWIWKDPARRERLCRIYNDRFNSIRPREYDGNHIKFVGMNPEITLRAHQKNAVARKIYGGNTLDAHVVGAGKTYTMVAAAQESKRLGLCNKSLFVVPNHLTEQWASEYLQLYPAANILVATKKDFETKNRKKFCARIATGDYDAVIIGHSQFEKIPMSVERQRYMLEQQIDDLVNGIDEVKRNKGEKFTIKQMERLRKSLEVRLSKLNDQSRKDDVVTFEELGVDRLFIDEAHYFKNLFLITKMRNVGGIVQTEAQKSSDLYMKCRYLDELTGGKGIVFATGTPISNSMVELYTMQRYLQYAELERNGLQHFDAWASTFGETVTAIELSPEGTGYRAKTRFAKFYNLPELMSMFKQIADIQTADMLNLPVPKANFHTEVIKPSQWQQDMVEELAERAENIRGGKVDPSVDNMLKVTNDGRKLALDQRLINPLLPDDPNGKVAVCASNIFRIWHETREERLAQLVFCDLSTPKNDGSFNVYTDMRDKLIAQGIPAEEIAFIHDADTEAKKKELFAKVRKGQIRVLMGSTQKMGAGTNVQDRLIALHDLDCPWRPADLEQRLGRIVRQGNKNPEVEIYRYVTEGTFDSYLYQLVENKQKFIAQIMTSKTPVRIAEDVDEIALSYAEIKALATGNPLIIEKCQLEMDVNKLKILQASHLSQRYALEDKLLKEYPQEIKRLTERISGYKNDMETVAKHPADKDQFPPMTIGGILYAEKGDAGKAVIEVCKAMTSPDPVLMGEYRGFQMVLSFDTFGKEYRVTLQGKLTHTVTLGSDIHGNIIRLDNTLEGFDSRLQNCENQLAETQLQMKTAQGEVLRPFPQEQEYLTKSTRLKEVNSLLNMDEKDSAIFDFTPDEGDIEPTQKVAGLER